MEEWDADAFRLPNPSSFYPLSNPGSLESRNATFLLSCEISEMYKVQKVLKKIQTGKGFTGNCLVPLIKTTPCPY